ncbi:MAG: M13 family metallopeptidase [Methanococcaceae archaeon]
MLKHLLIIVMIGLCMTEINYSAGGRDNKDAKNKALDPANIDKSVKPSVDFYEYANGSWLKNNPIPDEYTRWGSFEILAESNYKILKEILESAAKSDAPKVTIRQKVGDLYKTGMDEARIESEGAKPLAPIMKEIDNIKSLKDLVSEIAAFHGEGFSALFNFSSGADAKNSVMEIAQLDQGGLGLPDRDYYIKDDARSKEVREKYVTHIINMFKLAGFSAEAAAKNADVIMAIETRLAKASMDRVEMRDPNKTYNKMAPAKLIEMAPGFDWTLYFTVAGIENPGDINVSEPEFFKAISQAMKEVELKDWKTYLKWNLLHNSAYLLSSNFVNERFDFADKFLNGAKVLQPRWKRIMRVCDGLIGEALGQLYVKETFTPEAKDRAKKIVASLLDAMGERIKNVDWMSAVTKEQALKKLASFTVKIGYPDKWTDYKPLTLGNTSYFENVLNAERFHFKRTLNKIGKPVDKTQWGMSPQTVNAYYNPSQNEIVFPAAILQPPFYSVDADDAVNYGAMGAVIGHEVTHGFDDQGRQFDAQGNLTDWWTKEDGEKFTERARLIIAQYNNYTPVDTMHLNGSFTQGENIADLGGLNVALTAFKKTEEFKKNEVIDGFTPVQRFFLSWAQVWRGNIRDQNLMMRIKTDPHSPGKYRVNGPVCNMPEFWEAFSVKPGDPMAKSPETLVKIW